MATARLDMGGGIVRRAITLGNKKIPIGTILSAQQLGDFKIANLRSMISHRQIEIWPAAANGGQAVAGTRFLIPREDGKFDVGQGEIVNTKPLSLKIAEKMVAQGKN